MPSQLRAVAEDLGITLTDADVQSFLALMEGSLAAYDAVDAMPDYFPPVTYPRTPGYRPEGAENPYNAWYVKTTVKAASGALAGKTVVLKATPLPPADASREPYVQRAFEMIANTAPFDATGHPATSIPCGQSEGLPVGLMLVAKHWDETTIYRAAHAFEQAGDWLRA